MKKTINILAVRIDGGTQPREQINLEVVNEYADAITAGAVLPPPVVFHDGADYWLADGFHRYHANKKIGAVSLEVEVQQGTQRDAILYSLGANDSHGLRRSNQDKRKAVMTMLQDKEWVTWPQAKIAKTCCVSREYVSRLHAELSASCDRSQDTTRTVEREGKTYQQNTANIGKKVAPVEPVKAAPEPVSENHSHELDEAAQTIRELAEENERLLDRLAVEVMDASEEEKTSASETIAELRNQVKSLEAELDAVKGSRDTYMRENAELKKQVAMMQRQIKKLGG
jgi:FtsZ-binding cell division protein ZapB